jgi:hypothetical protein
VVTLIAVFLIIGAIDVALLRSRSQEPASDPAGRQGTATRDKELGCGYSDVMAAFQFSDDEEDEDGLNASGACPRVLSILEGLRSTTATGHDDKSDSGLVLFSCVIPTSVN